jgi:hypothetical protein
MSGLNHAIGGWHIYSLNVSWGKDWLTNLGQSVPALPFPPLTRRYRMRADHKPCFAPPISASSVFSVMPPVPTSDTTRPAGLDRRVIAIHSNPQKHVSNGTLVLVFVVGVGSSKEQANPAILGLTHHREGKAKEGVMRSLVNGTFPQIKSIPARSTTPWKHTQQSAEEIL